MRYEDLAGNMVDVMASLYNRLGLQWTDAIRFEMSSNLHQSVNLLRTEVESHTEGSADQDKDIYDTVR